MKERKQKLSKILKNNQEGLMEEIKSGKELCDDFFESLLKRGDIDRDVVNLLTELYINGNFKKEKILQSLQLLREGNENEQ